MALTLLDAFEMIKAKLEEDPANGEKALGFSYNYGDYWKTTVVAYPDSLEVTEVVLNKRLDMDAVAEDSDSDDEVREVITFS